MARFLVRRLLLLLPVMLGILVVTFVLVRLIPGDPCKSMLGERATEEKCNAFRERFGLNDPIPVQFVRYAGNVAQGDFGVSIKNGRPVTDVLAERLPMTMELTLFAMLFASVFGIALGVISAVRHNTAVDVGAMIFANIGVSMPVFWLGLILAYVFALALKGTPLQLPPSGRLTAGTDLPSLLKVWGMEDAQGLQRFVVLFISNSVLLNSLIQSKFDVFVDALRHLILPAVAVGTISLAIIARMTRGALLDALTQDYVRVARAKGLTERLVILKHALRNALVPIVTIIGLQIGGLLSGAVLTETVFSLPGVGTQIVDAITARDYPVVQAFTVLIAVIFVVVNLIVDLSYAYLNPRIRVS
ncbi:MAG: ABC transporter permease [Chloroflexi bacterium]|jgi:peptide/nickel transport system permease protein|uniref:Peptide ABC transporter permease n=1 Tax=Candidatus Thermofonsia Clade 3 bacterium TaxID=2364212 RepID=A0A2M8QDA7_9CHLR|nr:ABC transporter permease [Candidatus Roseilinea sp. NK_OTU-006]PJF47796.1 MAG: peptide ABC transporter permease [Candidatus Thermofonsia Clade 3 bacterium]RMG64610.1 MAG: ABC transporter permease [Chloroflexota bacterium]